MRVKPKGFLLATAAALCASSVAVMPAHAQTPKGKICLYRITPVAEGSNNYSFTPILRDELPASPSHALKGTFYVAGKATNGSCFAKSYLLKPDGRLTEPKVDHSKKYSPITAAEFCSQNIANTAWAQLSAYDNKTWPIGLNYAFTDMIKNHCTNLARTDTPVLGLPQGTGLTNFALNSAVQS